MLVSSANGEPFNSSPPAATVVISSGSEALPIRLRPQLNGRLRALYIGGSRKLIQARISGWEVIRPGSRGDSFHWIPTMLWSVLVAA